MITYQNVKGKVEKNFRENCLKNGVSVSNFFITDTPFLLTIIQDFP